MLQEADGRRITEFLTVGEAAAFLGVSPWTLRNWDKAGKLKPGRHPKNKYRIYRKEDLQAVLEGHEAVLTRLDKPVPHFDWTSLRSREHFVQFYESDSFLIESVSDFIRAGLEDGEVAH